MAGGQEYKRRRIRWALGATGLALTLWGILSLSETYTWKLEIPLIARIDTTREALAEPIPRTLSVLTRADGWTLMQISADDDIRCRIDPAGRSGEMEDTLRVYNFTEQEIANSINLPQSVTIQDVQPRTLRLILTNLALKRVPLYYPDIMLSTRSGFRVIGQPRVTPDSVWLSGSPEALEKISYWETTPLSLKDIYTSVNVIIPVSDTLHGVINVRPEYATVTANVQEVAELTLKNLYVINRNPVPDSVSKLVLYPDRISVTLRGGAGELGLIGEDGVIPYVELNPLTDTSGFAQARVLLPPSSNATIIGIQPNRIRYIWRKPLPTETVKTERSRRRGRK